MENKYGDCLHQNRPNNSAEARTERQHRDRIGELLWNDIYWPNRRYECALCDRQQMKIPYFFRNEHEDKKVRSFFLAFFRIGILLAD